MCANGSTLLRYFLHFMLNTASDESVISDWMRECSVLKVNFIQTSHFLLIYMLHNIPRDVDISFSSLQDVSKDDIPIMLVGNKTDLRNQALQDGITCIPTSYGEKLAMVRAL